MQYLLNIIYKARRSELEINAKLHNMKLKPELTSIGVTREERAEYDKQAQDAYNRLKERYKQNQGR